MTIRDDDPPPTITIRDGSVTEGTSANQVVRLAVSLSDPSAFTVRVAFDTVPGSADARQDYVAASGTVTFAPGATSATISVPIVADTLVEPDEDFTVALSNPSNATIADGTAVVTILDDDGSTRGPSGTSSTRRTLFTIPGRA